LELAQKKRENFSSDISPRLWPVSLSHLAELRKRPQSFTWTFRARAQKMRVRVPLTRAAATRRRAILEVIGRELGRYVLTFVEQAKDEIVLSPPLAFAYLFKVF